MQKEADYHAVDMIFPTLCGFIARVTGYKKTLTMTRVHAIYCSSMSTVTSDNWRRKWTGEELKEFGLNVCEFNEEVVVLSSSVCTSAVYIIKFYLLDHLVEGIRRSWDV